MTKFPMNQNTPKGQTHTIMESPVWVAKLYSYWMTFAVTWFSLFWIRIQFSHLLSDGISELFPLAIPLVVAVYIDKYFTQSFFKRDWEESKKMDAMAIRGIPIPKIREYIEFQMNLRKQFILCSSGIYTALTFWSTDSEYVITLLMIFAISLLIGALVRMKIGNDKFGFNSSYFSDIKTFKTYNH